MRAIFLSLTTPIQIGRRPVVGLDAEALLGALDHGHGCADLGLPDGTRGFDINDAELHIDQIVCRPINRSNSPVLSGR
jgi:hypothetical protein